MKKNKSSIIAGKFLASNSFKNLVHDYRIKLGIPIGGFENDLNTQNIWLNTISSTKINIANNFIRDVNKVFPSFVFMSKNSSFPYFLFRYLVSNKVEIFENLDVSGCDYELIFGSNREEIKNKLDDGIYIRIGTYTNKTDFKKFIERKWSLIEYFRDEFKRENKLPLKEKRVRASTKEGRDRFIYFFSTLSNQKLKEWLEPNDTVSVYKDINISRIIKRMGYEVSAENVRKVISNQNKLRK